MPDNLFEWDELNVIRQEAIRLWGRVERPDRKRREEFCDWLEFVLCHVYAYGWQGVEDILGKIDVPENGDLEAVNLEIAGETFRDRILKEDSVVEILRVIDTEAHRDFNTGVYNAAKASGRPNLKKKWITMRDDRVRDTHQYIDGMVVGIDDSFYTFDGDSALYPGGFEKPENNVNCRCGITVVP